MSDAIERLRTALQQERREWSVLNPAAARIRRDTDEALDALDAAITPSTEAEAPVDRRDEPVTLGVLNAIVATAWHRASGDRDVPGQPLTHLLDAIREEFR